MCIRQFIEFHTQIPATDQTVTELETLLLPKLMNLYDRAKPSSINNGADQLIKLLRELEWSTFSAARNWSQTEFLEALVRTRQFASAFEHLVAEHQANQPIIRQDNLAATHRDR